MRIQRVEISNFRSLINFDLQLEGRSALIIGENAGGKTSLLTAIARALGRDQSFSSADFADLQQPITANVTLTDLNDDQKGTFGNYADFGRGEATLQVGIRAVWNFMAEQAETEHGYPRHPGARSRRDEREALPVQWLSSARDAGRMLQFGVARNLMSQVLEGLPLQVALDEAVKAIQDASGSLGREQVLDGLLTSARNALATMLPDVGETAFSMGLSGVTPRDLLRQFELVVEYLGGPVSVSRQSSGLSQLAIFVFAMRLAALDQGTILLIDEPEISLHPQSQRALMRALRSLGTQVLVATHSANLLDRADPRSVVRLRRTIAGVESVAPRGLTDDEARRLSRFTSTQTAEAFFARSVVLVEGMSDQLALEALAERMERNLDAEGVAIVPMGGAKAVGRHIELFGPHGFQLKLAGLCDAAEEGDFRRALERGGMGAGLTRDGMERLGFYVCSADLEDELTRCLGTTTVERIIVEQGDLQAFNRFRQQPAMRGLDAASQQRSFIGGDRKIQYAPLLVDGLDLAEAPSPLARLLAHV
jgi:predicted ATPase